MINWLEFARKPLVLPSYLFALAFGINLIGIGWGLPNEKHYWSYHPDEPIVWAAAQDAPVPGFYNYGTLYLDLVKAATTIAVGTTPDSASLTEPAEMAKLMARSHLLSRLVSAVSGAMICLGVFLFLKRSEGRLAGIAAALLLIFAPALSVHSRFATVDVLATALICWSLLAANRLSEQLNPNRDFDQKMAIAGGVLAGLAAGTKISAALAILGVLVAAQYAPRGTRFKLSILSICAFALAFLIATPGAILDTNRFLSDVLWEAGHTQQGHGILFANTSPAAMFHLGNLTSGIGALSVVLGFVGVGIAAWKRKTWCLIALACALPYYGLISFAEVKFLRYTFPLYLLVAMGFGWIVAAGHRRQGIGRFIVALGILGLGGETNLTGLRGVLTYSGWMAGDDPRDQAAEWIHKRTEADSTVGVGSDPWFYTPPLYAEAGMPRPAWEARGREVLAGTKSPRVVIVEGHIRPDFIVTSSLEFGPAQRLARLRNTPPDAAPEVDRWKRLEEVLRNEYKLATVFGGRPPSAHDLEYVRPQIAVYERRREAQP